MRYLFSDRDAQRDIYLLRLIAEFFKEQGELFTFEDEKVYRDLKFKYRTALSKTNHIIDAVCAIEHQRLNDQLNNITNNLGSKDVYS